MTVAGPWWQSMAPRGDQCVGQLVVSSSRVSWVAPHQVARTDHEDACPDSIGRRWAISRSGRYAEYFVKMEFTMHGSQVFGAEVDVRGIDFVARREGGRFLEVQVKSVRNKGYIFVQKTKARLSADRLVAVVVFAEGREPDLFLIPMTVWCLPDGVFVDRDYLEGASKPEYGITLSAKNRARLEPYRFHSVLGQLGAPSSEASDSP